MAIKKFKVNASKQAKSIKKRIVASELLSGIDKLPERGKVITKTIKGDPVVIVGIGDNKYMYKSYLNKASATGDVQFIRNLIKKGEVPANAVKNLGYKLYTSSGSVDSACGKKSVKASSSLKVKPYVINKGQSGEYYGLKNAGDNQVLHSAPNNWKSERGAINWAKKKGYDVVDSACGKKSVKSDKVAASKKFTAKAAKSIKAARNSKTMVELVLQGNYGYGWDDLVSYDNTPEGRKEMKDDLKTYQQEEGGRASFRTIERRVANPDYKAPADRFRVTPYKLGFKYKDGDTVKFTDMEEAIEYATSQDKDVVLKDVVTGYNVQISNDTSFGMSGQERDNFNKRNIRNFRQVVGESETVESSVSAKKRFGVKASKSAKKRKAIKASGIQNDIVMYFNGDNVYQGSVYDLADAVENLCYDDEVNAKFQEWCNQFGDPFDFDGSPIDTARVFTDIIIHEAEESPVSEDGQSEFYEDGDGILDFEIFYADEFSIDGAKKSIKCSAPIWPESEYKTHDVYEVTDPNGDVEESFDSYEEAESYAKSIISDTGVAYYDIYHVVYKYNSEYDEWDDGEKDEWVGKVTASAKKSIKCSSSDNYDDLDEAMRFRVCSYYDAKFRDLAECKVFDDFDEAVDYAHECLGKGPTTIEDYYVGTVEIDPDEYWDNFDGEFWCTPELANFRDEVWKSMGIGASTDITAALNKKSDINDEQYNQALADEVADMLRADGFEDIEVSVAPEAISFFINDEVMFVQPTNMITPNMADIYDDCKELFNAVKEATTDKMWKLYDEENKAMRDAWEDSDIDDPDYATRAVTLSRKAKGKDISAAEETIDIDDLDYISGDDEQEDWGYGFDSNGEPVTESMVEELERIAQETLDKSEIHNIDKYADLHNFNYYASIPYIQESFDISFTYVADIYELSKNGMATDEGIYTTVAPYNIHFNVRCENGEVEYAECTDVDVNDGYVKDVELTNFNLDALVQFATDLVNPVAMDIYNATTNI